MQEVQSPRRTPLSEQKHKNGNRERGRNLVCYACHLPQRTDAMHLLKKENLGYFIPMQYKICIKKGKKVRALVPVVHNLLFVHARPSDVQRVKSQVTYLQYITDTRSGQKIIVPDSQMQRFIAVSGTYDDHLLYFQPDELNLSKGTKVRITGGEFEGQEGVFLKVKVHVTVAWLSKYKVS